MDIEAGPIIPNIQYVYLVVLENHNAVETVWSTRKTAEVKVRKLNAGLLPREAKWKVQQMALNWAIEK